MTSIFGARNADSIFFITSRLIALFTIWVLSATAGICAGTSGSADQVQSDVRSYLSALYDGDVDRVVHLTHSKVIELDGGDWHFRLHQTNMARMMRGAKMRLLKVAFPSSPRFLEGEKGRRFVIVPHIKVVSAIDGRRDKVEDFKLGILEPGATDWKYVGGEIGEKGIQTVFPDFPPEVELPARMISR
jgi:hypothetical protein